MFFTFCRMTIIIIIDTVCNNKWLLQNGFYTSKTKNKNKFEIDDIKFLYFIRIYCATTSMTWIKCLKINFNHDEIYFLRNELNFRKSILSIVYTSVPFYNHLTTRVTFFSLEIDWWLTRKTIRIVHLYHMN